MNNRHLKVLRRISAKPTPKNVTWSEFAGLLIACGAVMAAGRGSHVRFTLRGLVLPTYRPHGGSPEMKPYQLRAAIDFLEKSGILKEIEK